MKILVCGAQVPFGRGGAEQHMENLVEQLAVAGHEAELVRLPTAWDKVRIFDAAMAWRLVPLDADLVIATNFPSYFARHPNKVVWLFHQHRIAYDSVDQPWSDFGLDDTSIEAQRLLTEWDRQALSEARHVFTTSRTVAGRLAAFNGVPSEALYHPPPLYDRLRPGPFGDYVVCPGRLERNKRPDLPAGAAQHLTTDSRVVLVGTGSMRDELEATRVGAVAQKLELRGFVSDDELLDLYANALGVVYAPFDEDYGYVTLQAFFAGKPVITSTDAGGVLEWVEDGVNGYVTDGSPQGIAAAIDKLAADPDHARAMGEAGRARVATLDWASVVDRLVTAAR